VYKPSSRVSISHLGWNLPLIRDEERSRQRSVVTECQVDRSGGPSSDSRQQVVWRSRGAYVRRRTLRRRARHRDDRSRCEDQDEGDALVTRAKQSDQKYHRRDSDGDPCEPAESN
jgi:hypothetical protein